MIRWKDKLIQEEKSIWGDKFCGMLTKERNIDSDDSYETNIIG